MSIATLDSDFWARLREVAKAINARPEDLIVVLASESAGTMNPKATDWARFGGPAPKTWAEVKDRCRAYYEKHHGGNDNTGWFCGGLGLNTIMADTAAMLGISPQEWWSIPDQTPTKALDYTEKFFRYLLDTFGQGKTGYVNALDLYLANAAMGAWRIRPLTMSTVVYGPNTGYSGNVSLDNIGISDTRGVVVKPGRSGKKGYVDVEDMKNAVLNSYSSLAQRFLKQYQDYLSVAQLEGTPNYNPVATSGHWSHVFTGQVALDYKPEELDGDKALKELNRDGLLHPIPNVQDAEPKGPSVPIELGKLLGYSLAGLALGGIVYAATRH